MIEKTPGVKSVGIGLMLGVTLFVSCSKDISEKTAATLSTEATQLVLQPSESVISDSALRAFFKAPFSSRGSRTTYRGYVSDTTATISLDYLIDKKFGYAGDKTLTLDYGDYSLYNRGWKYLVVYDKKTGGIALAPNDVMASQTEPGSFKTIVATFDKASSTFTFLTEVKDLDGFVHQVTDIATRK